MIFQERGKTKINAEKKALYQERLGKIVNSLNKSNLDAVFLMNGPNIAYFTGAFSSCSWVFITKRNEQVALILDSDFDAYQEESVIQDIRAFRERYPFSLLNKIAEELGLTNSKVGLELGRAGLSTQVFNMLRYVFPSSLQLVDGENLLQEIRAIKSGEEIEVIKKAAKIAEMGMETAMKSIKPGVQEKDIILETEFAMRRAGGRSSNINYIGSGKRSCMAHQIPSLKKIEEGDVVTLDIHAAFQGYCADLARTCICRGADKEVEKAYASLTRAQENEIGACRNGAKLIDIMKVFYKTLGEAKHLTFPFAPPLHGVGMENYEMPYFQFPSHEKGSPEAMKTNMVVATSHVGLYSKQKAWGVRVEDTIWVKENEPVYLTHFTKELLTI